MLNLILFILICYGITQIVTYGQIFNSIRPKYKFFHCPMCIGFWVGWAIAILNKYSMILNFAELAYVDYLFLASLSSGTSYILCQIIDDEGIRIK